MAFARCQLHPHIGAWAELVACERLLAHGLEVFRNISSHGPHDLVVMRRESFECVPVDVTVGTWYTTQSGVQKMHSTAVTKMRKERCCKVLIVTDERDLYSCWLEEYRGDMILRWKLFEPGDLFPGLMAAV